MLTAVISGGICLMLGTVFGYRLARTGHRVDDLVADVRDAQDIGPQATVVTPR